jgi:transcription initiation factor TFIIB
MKRGGGELPGGAVAAAKRARMPQLPPAMERELPPECPECGCDDIVEDWRQGNAVCRGCGLVLAEHLLDVSSEWRTFTAEEGDDPNRVGGPVNPLLESGLGTDIGAVAKGGAKVSMGLKNTQQRNAMSAWDKTMLDVMARVDRMCERLSLQGSVGKRAKELFKRYQDCLTLEEDGVSRKRTLRDEEVNQIIAASLFVACRNEQGARSYKEICGLTNVSKKDIGTMVKKIEMAIPSAKTAHVRGTEDFVTRFCNKLNLPREMIGVADSVAKAARDQDGVYGKQYLTIAAASIYIVCQLSEDKNKRTEKQISDVSGVAEVTIKSTFRHIVPHLEAVVPPDFKNFEPLSSLRPRE